MRSMEFSGRTVDEAIFHGLNEMGVTIDQVEIITVKSESKGIFGIGARNAVVRLVEREAPVVPNFEAINEERREQRETEKRQRPPRDDSRGRSFDKRRSDRPERAPAAVEAAEEPEAAVSLEEQEAPYTIEAAENCGAAKFLQELLGKMNIEGQVKALVDEESIRLVIDSKTDGLLIGRRGETLDALQYITSLFENKDRKDNGYRRVSIDTEGYRARREDTLRRLARRNAIRVVKTGKPMAMEPMNPYERRILHAALQSFRGVTTHSEGEEPNRRVIITPEK